MNRFFENGLLSSDIDCAGFNIINLPVTSTPPANVVGINDPRLSDPRPPLNGSVTDSSVSGVAAISQSKLSLNGVIPPAWMGTGSTQAAQGDLVERTSRRSANNGYAPLNNNGTLNVSRLPSTGPAAGTVLIVDFSMPLDFNVSVGEVTSSGVLAADWNPVPDKTWFGAYGTKNPGWTVGQPFFVPDFLPDGLVPNLPASKFTTGTFPVERFPVASPIGVSSAKGMVPDPGEAPIDSHPSDYLGRDMTWRRMNINVSYQPTLDPPLITFLSGSDTGTMIRISARPGASLFYQVSSGVSLTYTQAPSNPYVLSVPSGSVVKAYAAKAGYNNSNIAAQSPGDSIIARNLLC